LKVPQAQNRAVLWATLKKCEADLELFSLVAHNKEARNMYANHAAELRKIILNLTPLLKRWERG
jgi:hypothetical protein